MQKKYQVSGVWRTGIPKRMRRRTAAEELEMVRADAATAWDKCEERRKNEERLKALIAELLDDPLVIDGAPPGLGWFERAEEAVGRPVGSSFDKATLRRREEQALTMSMFLRKEDLEDERSSALSSHHHSGEVK